MCQQNMLKTFSKCVDIESLKHLKNMFKLNQKCFDKVLLKQNQNVSKMYLTQYLNTRVLNLFRDIFQKHFENVSFKCQ